MQQWSLWSAEQSSDYLEGYWHLIQLLQCEWWNNLSPWQGKQNECRGSGLPNETQS